MLVQCHDCGNTARFTIEEWRCTCGGAWELASKPDFDIHRIRKEDHSIWRYGEMLGLDIVKPKEEMGVGWTPLVPVCLFGRRVHCKLEFLSPSGSFKDRGVNAMVNQLVHMGVKTVVEDSSGNAGASLAAHAARFGLAAQIFVPAYASPAKRYQIAVYGVDVVPVPGPRRAAEAAAQAAVGPSKAYASHAYNPAYLAGQVTAAWEIWEQLDRRSPDWILCPVAQGGQFLGYWFGFTKLLEAGLIDHLPHMVAVQPALIAPIFKAWSQNLDHVPAVAGTKPTIAEGTAIPQPIRGKRLLQVLRETDGLVIPVEEAAILRAQKNLAHLGFFVEPTSALVAAGLHQLLGKVAPDETIIMPLTGSGLKGAPQIEG